MKTMALLLFLLVLTVAVVYADEGTIPVQHYEDEANNSSNSEDEEE